MRLNAKVSKKLFEIIRDARKVGNLIISQTDINNLLYTVNTINALSRDKHVLGDYLLDDYEIPETWDFLIVPVEIKACSDTLAKDIKDQDYYKGIKRTIIKTQDGTKEELTNLDLVAVDFESSASLLSPTEFKVMWASILGSYKSADKTWKKVKDVRVSTYLTTDGTLKSIIERDQTSHLADGKWPTVCTFKPFEDYAYSYPLNTFIEKKFLTVIVG